MYIQHVVKVLLSRQLLTRKKKKGYLTIPLFGLWNIPCYYYWHASLLSLQKERVLPTDAYERQCLLSNITFMFNELF